MSIQATLLEQQAKEQYNEGNYQAAYDFLQEAIAVDDTDNMELLERAIDIAHEHLTLFQDVVNYANIILLQDETKNRVRLQRAWSNYDLGHHSIAFDDFQYVIEEPKDDRELMYARSGRGLAYYMLNHYEEAVEDLEAALLIYTEWPVGFAHLGWAQYYLKEYQKARESFEKAIELSKDVYTYAHAGRGLVCYELYEYDQAIDDLTIGLEDNEKWSQGYATRGWSYLDIRFYQNQYELAVADFTKAIELQETPYTYAYAGRGVTHFELKNYEAAIADLLISLDDNKNWLRGYAVYGWSLFESGQYEAALEPLNYAIENSEEENYPFARGGRGLTYFELSKYQEAQADLTFALIENPDWLRGKAVLAWSQYEVATKQEEYEAALSIFDDALKNITDYPFGFGGRGLTHYELKHYQEAVADLDQALNDESTWARGYAVRGWSKYFLAANEEEYEAAKVDFDKSIEYYEGENKYPLSGRGYVHYKLGAYQQAVEDFEAALTEYTDWESGYIYLAKAYYELEEYEAAKAVYQKAFKVSPDSASLHFEYALLLEDIKDYPHAIEEYQKAIDLEPKSWMCGSLAELYLRGMGTKPDFQKAFELFQKAYDLQMEKQDVSYFDATLINCYYQEFGVQDNPERVKEILTVAKQNENENVEFLLLLIYFHYFGIYVDQDKQEVKHLLETAVKLHPEHPWVSFYEYVLNFDAIEKEQQKEKIKKEVESLNYEQYKKDAILQELTAATPTLLYPMYEKEN